MSILDKIVGTSWKLLAFQSEDEFGDINFPLGEHAKGIIIFTNEERTAVQIMAEKPIEVTEESIASMNTQTESKMATMGYHAYSSPFAIDEEQSLLTTYVDMSLVAEYVGTDQVRKVSIEGNTLYLSNIDHPERKITWQKIEKTNI